MKGLGEAAYIVWMSFGIVLDKVNESVNSLEMYISVPSSSYHYDANNNQMAGDFLAKRFKTVLTEIGIKRLTVKYKIRNEHWTEEMSKNATVRATQEIYGSQWWHLDKHQKV